jgi:VanZ family protein
MTNLYRLLFAGSILGIMLLSIAPLSELGVPSFNDKLFHIISFLYLGIISILSKFNIDKIYLFILLISYGLLIEIAQSFLSYRYFEINDLLADLIGVTIAFGFFRIKKAI